MHCVGIFVRLETIALNRTILFLEKLHEETAVVGQTIRQTLPGLWLCKRTLFVRKNFHASYRFEALTQLLIGTIQHSISTNFITFTS